MRHQRHHLEAPVVEAKEDAQAHVVDAGAEGAVEGVEAPHVVGLLRAGGVPLGVGLLVVGLLEDLVGADAGGLDGAEAGLVEGGRVDVHAADLAAAFLGGVDQARGVGDEVGVVLRALAVDQDQALVAQVLQRLHLAHQLLVGEGVAHGAGEGAAEAAVLAVVAAGVAHVERGEEDDAVAVDLALQRARGLEDLLHQLRALRAKQDGRLLDGQGLLAQALGDDGADGRGVLFQTGDHRLQLRVIDEVRRVGGQCGVHVIHRVSPSPGRAFSCFVRTCRAPP